MAYNKISNLNQDRDLKYLNKDFNTFKKQLIEFTKTYYPKTYSDFSVGSPGMMFMEMTSYVGDVLAFYLDTQIQETFLNSAQERTNIYNLAYTLGYKPRMTTVSACDLQIQHLIPAIGTLGNKSPDWNYALTFDPPSSFKSDSTVTFNIQQKVDFNYSSSFDPTNISIYSLDGNNDPEYYLLTKNTPVISSTRVTKKFSVGDPERYKILNLIDNNIISIESITDSEGFEWTEVPYLAQDTVFEDISNTQTNTPTLYEYQVETPFLLKIKKVPRRFTCRFTEKGILEIQFGAGSSDVADEEVLPIPDNVGLGNRDGRSKLDQAIDPSNFLHSKTYGRIPSNTVLTVTYLKGGGIRSNVPSNTIQTLDSLTITNNANTNPSLLSFVKESIACNNMEPATGGGRGDTIEDIRQNTLAQFNSQQRIITRDDYLIRTLSMPAKYGSVSKAFIVKDSSLGISQTKDEINPLASNLYILGYDRNKKLIDINSATKHNLITYLSYYKTLTDSVNIKDAFVINIGLEFEISTYKNTNNQKVLLDCITNLKNYFNIDKWQINQPIIKSEILNIIAGVQGVQSVLEVTYTNKVGGQYSRFKYDLDQATKREIIYPSLDPSIFEVKYPNTDIKGKITQY